MHFAFFTPSPVPLFFSSECAESEEKAAAEFNKVKEGMKVLTEKMDDIAAKKKEKGKEHCTLYK